MRLKFITKAVFLLMLPLIGQSQGFKVSGHELKDANGNTFIMKGLNVPLAWYQNDVLENIRNIKKNSGANTLRIVVGAGITPLDGSGQNWSTPDAVWQAAVDSTIRNKMIPMLEVHNILGSNDSLDLKAVTQWWISKKDYLTRPDIAKYVLINIANEWGDWYMSQPSANAPNQVYWRDAYITAVKRLRAAGITTTLVIDAPGYGQDKGATSLLTHAPAIINADPEKNLLFAIHTYCEWNTSNGAKATTVFPLLKNAGIPFIVGEVADSHPDGNGGTCPIPAEQIMGASVQYNSGYLGWSWKGNGGGTEALDMSADWAGTQLTAWGNTFVNSAVGTKSAVEASVFGGGSTNKMPVVTITSPVNNATFQSPASITIEATASDEDGRVQRVDFYQGSVKIGQDTSAPYHFTWENVQKGTYSFTAFAVDNVNGSGISNSVSVLVTSANGNILSNGEFETGTQGWELQVTAPGTATLLQDSTADLSGTNSLRVCPGNPGTLDYHIMAVTKASITQGQRYEISFLAKADTARTIKVGFQQFQGKWRYYNGSEFNISTSPELYSFAFTADTTDPAIDIKFMFGLSRACVNIDNVIFSTDVLSGLGGGQSQGLRSNVFPNPFTGNMTVITAGTFRYEIRNQAGQLTEKGTGTDQAELGESLAEGLYFLKIIAGSKTKDLKIVKQ